MAIKKSDLYSSLWKSCDELRGGMDASQYKDYVLVLLFVKYVSDKYMGQRDALLEVPKGGSFANMVALKGDKEIGDKINKIIGKLAEANDLKGIIDVADFNDSDKLGKEKEKVDRLSNLIGIFNTPALDFKGNRAEGDDILGDAYEYLMRHFATESGKSKGQFYTPAEVSRIMAKVIGMGEATSAKQTIHDPACGSGSLLLKAHDEAKGSTGHDLTIYGQEMDNATKALAKMNMILHDCPSAEIWQDNSLSTPHFKDRDGKLKTFDFVVANPPFSTKAWSNGFNPEEDEFKRFQFGDQTLIPPDKNGDYAFLLHILATLKSTGKGAVILPHGVLFRGGAEAAARKGLFMIDASKGFLKDGNKNRLRAQDIHLIVDAFTRQLELPRYSRMVPMAEIEGNDFNLNLPRYIDSTEPEDIQDIEGHLRGGIPSRDIDALDKYWSVFPAIRATLFIQPTRPTQKIPADMHAPYWDVYFQSEEKLDDGPESFAIITGYSTTGEVWTEAENKAADIALEKDLRKKSKWVKRLTGYSPETGHAEPGWAVDLDFESACDLGKRYRQDAIYYVLKQFLFVSHCDARRKLIKVGDFLSRTSLAGSSPRVRYGFCQLRLPASEIKAAIFGHAEFTTFNQGVTALFTTWKAKHLPKLKGIAIGGKPKALIETLSESLLETFREAPLIDTYDMYQHLMDMWSETMQDDVYMIVSDGWKEAAKPRLIIEDKEKKTKEQADYTIGKLKYKAELIPMALVIARYFAKEAAAIEGLEAEAAGLEQKLEELKEEHGGDEGLMAEVIEEGKIAKGSVAARLKTIKTDKMAADERKVLEAYLDLVEQAATASKEVKVAQNALEEKVAAQYGKLGEADIKTLVVEDKWLATLGASVQSELDRVSQALTGRVRELAERYGTPLPEVLSQVEELEKRVAGHLKKMGFTV